MQVFQAPLIEPPLIPYLPSIPPFCEPIDMLNTYVISSAMLSKLVSFKCTCHEFFPDVLHPSIIDINIPYPPPKRKLEHYPIPPYYKQKPNPPSQVDHIQFLQFYLQNKCKKICLSLILFMWVVVIVLLSFILIVTHQIIHKGRI